MLAFVLLFHNQPMRQTFHDLSMSMYFVCIFQDSGGDFTMFRNLVREAFECYMPYVCRYGDVVAACFESLPTLEPSKVSTTRIITGPYD